jgi:hypothetical protein
MGMVFSGYILLPKVLCLANYSRPTMADGGMGLGLKPPTGSGPQSSTVDSNRSATAQLSGQFTVEYN